jgi:arylsulfatase A-like enzyme/tetratricopeptide (TPR) repeat protein
VRLALAVGLLAPLGCEQRAARQETHPANGLNVLLISIDTLRADHLGCYGHPAIKTPNIDRIAAAGTLFEACTTPAPITLPAHTSIMTGTYPFTHGARDNARFHVHEQNLTLAEVLRDAGFATAAQVGAYVLNREFGLDQGFDTYEDVATARRAWLAATDPTASERRADAVAAGAGRWLREHANETFFLFVHFFDPHAAYDPPARFAAQYGDPYLGEIAYVDEQVGRLLDVLDEHDLARRTLVVLTADHGEGLDEHGEETHAHYVYDATLAVPLIFRCAGVIPAGLRIDAPVRLIDVAPTVLALLGLPPLPDADGTSLLPLFSNAGTGPARPAYSETFYPKYSLGYSAWYRAWRRDGWKYIHGTAPELYRVSSDPGETDNLATREPERVAQMRDELRQLLSEARPVAPSVQHTLTPQDRRALQSLGYIDAGGEDMSVAGELAMFDPPGPEPRDFAEQNHLMSHAIGFIVAQDLNQAEQTLRKLLEQPSHPQGYWWAHKTLADVLAQQGRLDEAIAHYHKALESRPDDGEAYADLAYALMTAGQLGQALSAYEEALRHPPLFAETHHQYGVALALSGRRHEALEQQRAAVRLDPRFAQAHAETGALLAAMGRVAEARAAFEHAVELAPRGARIRLRFADFLLDQQRPSEALGAFEAALRLAPDSAPAHCGLGTAHFAMGRPRQAIENLRTAVSLDATLARAWLELGRVLLAERKYAEALEALRTGHRTEPRNARIGILLARLLAACPRDTLRDGAAALRIARDLERQTAGRDVEVLDVLAAALAETGRYSDAIEVIDRALRLADLLGRGTLVTELRQHRALYANDSPLRLPSP